MSFIKNKSIVEILENHPTKVPMIISKDPNSKLEELKKKKYLVTKDITMGQFIFVMRKYLLLNPTDAIFFL